MVEREEAPGEGQPGESSLFPGLKCPGHVNQENNFERGRTLVLSMARGGEGMKLGHYSGRLGASGLI